MKTNMGKWKKFIKRNLLIYLFMVVIFACGGYGVMSAALSVPDNPMSEQATNLKTKIDPLNSEAEEDDTVYIPLTVKSEDTDDGQEIEKTDAVSPEDPLQEDEADDSTEDHSQNNSSPSNQQSTSSSTGTGGTGGSTEPGGIPDNTTYFTTSIKDGETVTKTNYYFEIYHKIESLKVKEVYVYVNGVLQNQFNGNVSLSEGDNTIRVVVDYTDANGKLFSPSKPYTVKVDTKSLVINTSLIDGQTVSSSYLTFKASATYLGDAVDLTVKQDGSEITGDGETYHVTLKKGENLFTLSATAGNLTKTVPCKVIYIDDGQFGIDSDLEDQTVNEAAFSFKAKLVNQSNGAKITVTFNGKKISPMANDNYAVTLSYGNNTIRLAGVDGDGTTRAEAKTYTIRFERTLASADNPIPDPEHAPKISKINMTDGMSISGSVYTLELQAVDYQGKRIYSNNITVQLNGTTVGSRGEDGTTTTYRLEQYGENNTLTFLLKDSSGYSALYTYHFTYTAADGPIGTVTFSMEATTVGLGQIIVPIEVPIYDKEPFSYALDRILKEYGFTYSMGTNGSLDNLYLASISKEGLAKNYLIPEDLVATLLVDGQKPDSVYDENRLGEHDFYYNSGWVYQINGDSPNYGTSQYYPADGDVIRFRFTLNLGKDVGCAEAADGTSVNYDKEW